MVDQELILTFMGVGAAVGIDIVVSVGGLVWFLGAIYWFWQSGRELAQSVTEKAHERRVERLVKMIELEQAR
jgi:hypothetical protein